MGTRRLTTLATIAVAVLSLLAAVPPRAAAAPPPPGQSENLPDSITGTGFIVNGNTSALIDDRRVTRTSAVFAAVDATSWPKGDVALPGVKVNVVTDGRFTVHTLDEQPAPVSGVPFVYFVMNAKSLPFTLGGSLTASAGQIETNGQQVVVNDPAVKTTSAVILSITTNGLPSIALPPIKITNKQDGTFTVRTFNGSASPGTLRFNYLVVNEAGLVPGSNGVSSTYHECRLVCGTMSIPGPSSGVRVSKPAASAVSAIFATPNTSGTGQTTPIPGIKVQTHGAGFFRVNTARLEATPSSGLQFDYVILSPNKFWEEYGPTGRSGNTWTIQPDPSNPQSVWYVGSTKAGVWKTTDKGDTWYLAWKDTSGKPLPLEGVYRLTANASTRHLFAVTEHSRVYRSDNQGLSWMRLTDPPGDNNVLQTKLLASDGNDGLFYCAEVGLWHLDNGSQTWVNAEPPGFAKQTVSKMRCTDVVAQNGAVYAGFPSNGVYQLQSDRTWRQVKQAVNTNGTIRIALGSASIAVNDMCDVEVRPIADLSRADVLSTWPASGKGRWKSSGEVNDLSGSVCDGPGMGTYSALAAMSPNGKVIVAGGRGAFRSSDSGKTYPTHILITGGVPNQGEEHDFRFIDDQLVVAAYDGGVRISTDGGATWKEANVRSRSIDGPPTTEFYDLEVAEPDQFGQAALGGAVQDIGVIFMYGPPTGFQPRGGAEFAFTDVDPVPVNDSGGSYPSSQLRTYHGSAEQGSEGRPGSNGDISGHVDVCTYTVAFGSVPRPSDFQFGYDPAGDPCTQRRIFSTEDTISAIAAPRTGGTKVLFGGRFGTLILRDLSTDNETGLTYRTPSTNADDKVTALRFISDTAALAGHRSGALERIDNVFTKAGPTTQLPIRSLNGTPFSYTGPITAVSSLYGTKELYAAAKDEVFSSVDGGFSWRALIGPTGPVRAAIDSRNEIVGVVRDPSHPFVYIALGHARHGDESWYGRQSAGSVWRTAAPQSTSSTGPVTWTDFSQGFPPGMPITALGLSPNRGLFVATQGLGIWWRRDIVSEAPNSGVNTPDAGRSKTGRPTVITTTCAYPDGWTKIHTLAFALGLGQGVNAGAKSAGQLEVDQDRGVISLTDPVSGRRTVGRPGQHRVLSNRYVHLDLARTSFAGKPGDPTMTVRWALTFRRPASGRDLQQYLRVVDDRGDATTWDFVGTWHVDGGGGSRLPVIVVLIVVGMALVLIATRIARARRRATSPSR
jgi:photosystem II stability/assembly factor-like uncharacterized protein